MRASTVFALLATVAVSFAAPGTYTPAPSTPPAPDAATNTPPAGPPTAPAPSDSPAPGPAGQPTPGPAAGPTPGPAAGPTPSPAPAPGAAGYCNTNQASFCCNGDAAAAGGFLSLLALGGCGLPILSGGCGGAKTYCCATNQNGLINLGLCGSLLGDIL